MRSLERTAVFRSCNAMLMYFPLLLLSLYSVSFDVKADGWLPDSGAAGATTKAPNVIKNNEPSADGLRIGGIANTRHNLTMSYNNNAAIMDDFRNDYYEICVYCHTPHGANSTAAAPLWNRTVTKRTYTLYNDERQSPLDLKVSQPGPNSLTCLSCHDGATAIDSVINMPTQMTGPFRAGYQESQETNVDNNFLDAWSGNLLGRGSPGDPDSAGNHAGFNTRAGSYCLACHTSALSGQPGIAPEFTLFSIGDGFVSGETGGYLADDHPIGIEYPQNADGIDYHAPNRDAVVNMAFFDRNDNQRPDVNEVRLYNTGDGFEVECGSCHDPHGIKVSGENNNELIPSFLRMGEINPDVSSGGLTNSRALVSANSGSLLCLTCHVK